MRPRWAVVSLVTSAALAAACAGLLSVPSVEYASSDAGGPDATSDATSDASPPDASVDGCPDGAQTWCDCHPHTICIDFDLAGVTIPPERTFLIDTFGSSDAAVDDAASTTPPNSFHAWTSPDDGGADLAVLIHTIDVPGGTVGMGYDVELGRAPSGVAYLGQIELHPRTDGGDIFAGFLSLVLDANQRQLLARRQINFNDGGLDFTDQPLSSNIQLGKWAHVTLSVLSDGGLHAAVDGMPSGQVTPPFPPDFTPYGVIVGLEVYDSDGDWEAHFDTVTVDVSP
jgi:hypothetical protein